MDELIPIREHDGRRAVSGRDLHQFLEVATPYDKWFPRMVDYGFIEGQDFSTILSESTGGRPSTDHALTLDMAKEIAMIQRTEKGKQARQYFIECERRAQQYPQPRELSRLELIDLARESEIGRLQAEQQLEAVKPVMEYHEKFVAEDDDIITVDNFASQWNSSGPKVRELMKAKGIATRRVIGKRWSKSKGQMVDEHEWRPRQGKTTSEWFVNRPQHNAPRLHNGQVMQTMYIKQYYAEKLAERLGVVEGYQPHLEVVQ